MRSTIPIVGLGVLALAGLVTYSVRDGKRRETIATAPSDPRLSGVTASTDGTSELEEPGLIAPLAQDPASAVDVPVVESAQEATPEDSPPTASDFEAKYSGKSLEEMIGTELLLREWLANRSSVVLENLEARGRFDATMLDTGTPMKLGKKDLEVREGPNGPEVPVATTLGPDVGGRQESRRYWAARVDDPEYFDKFNEAQWLGKRVGDLRASLRSQDQK